NSGQLLHHVKVVELQKGGLPHAHIILNVTTLRCIIYFSGLVFLFVCYIHNTTFSSDNVTDTSRITLQID
ncbi:hypothetical protein BDD12DRAFT_730986, partial [Trichophaea hybrida]